MRENDLTQTLEEFRELAELEKGRNNLEAAYRIYLEALKVAESKLDPIYAGKRSQPPPLERVVEGPTIGLSLGSVIANNPVTEKQLVPRITKARRQLWLEMGLVLPAIQIKQPADLAANCYEISLPGQEKTSFEVKPGHYLAIIQGDEAEPIKGSPIIEPAFGLKAWWLQEADREQAQSLGYSVVNHQTILVTHLQELFKTHASHMLTHEVAQALLDKLAETEPRLVADLVPGILTLDEVREVLAGLLAEQVSIRDLAGILETLHRAALISHHPDFLLQEVRITLCRAIIAPIRSKDGQLMICPLPEALEHDLTVAFECDASPFPNEQETALVDFVDQLPEFYWLLVSPYLRRRCALQFPNLTWISSAEIPDVDVGFLAEVNHL